jgi:hypothetical protein
MPSPKNRLKLTGDTHPPELESDAGGDGDGDVLAFEPAPEEAMADDAAPGAEPREQLPGPSSAYLDRAREQVRARPIAALAGAFILGLLVARL